jgi:hypothetical protein
MARGTFSGSLARKAELLVAAADKSAHDTAPVLHLLRQIVTLARLVEELLPPATAEDRTGHN